MIALHKPAQAMAAEQRMAAAHGTMARCSRDWECVESKNSTKKARSRQRNCANTVPRQAHVLILASCRQDNILYKLSPRAIPAVCQQPHRKGPGHVIFSEIRFCKLVWHLQNQNMSIREDNFQEHIKCKVSQNVFIELYKLMRGSKELPSLWL